MTKENYTVTFECKDPNNKQCSCYVKRDYPRPCKDCKRKTWLCRSVKCYEYDLWEETKDRCKHSQQRIQTIFCMSEKIVNIFKNTTEVIK